MRTTQQGLHTTQLLQKTSVDSLTSLAPAAHFSTQVPFTMRPSLQGGAQVAPALLLKVVPAGHLVQVLLSLDMTRPLGQLTSAGDRHTGRPA